MIKANELRIGNYYDHYGRIEKASPNTIEEVWDAEREWCNHIPITEEWLLKFGYRKNTPFFTDGSIIEFYENNGMLFCELPDNNTMLHIKYVHQLQNLYFALTGEELVFSPTEP